MLNAMTRWKQKPQSLIDHETDYRPLSCREYYCIARKGRLCHRKDWLNNTVQKELSYCELMTNILILLNVMKKMHKTKALKKSIWRATTHAWYNFTNRTLLRTWIAHSADIVMNFCTFFNVEWWRDQDNWRNKYFESIW